MDMGTDAMMEDEPFPLDLLPQPSFSQDEDMATPAISSGTTIPTGQYMYPHSAHAHAIIHYPGQPSEEEEAARLQQVVMLHPLYPRLLDAITSCRKVGQSNRQDIAELDNRCKRAKALAASARDMAITQSTLPSEVHDPDLTEYLTQYIAAAERHKGQLSALYHDVEAVSREMETQVNHVLCGGGGSSGGAVLPTTSKASGMRTPGGASSGGAASGLPAHVTVSARGDTCHSATSSANGATSSAGEQAEALRSLLKRQYADTITALQEEFTKKRSKNKLPDDATSTLRNWWNAHFAWPYPTDEEKEYLGQQSGLSVQQVNNWFINQRKRHWHKLFMGAQPANEDDAREQLRKLGYIG